MKRAILLVLLLACGTAQAAEWVSVNRSAGERPAELFVDVSGIKLANGIRRAWDKLAPARHTLKGSGDNARRWVSYELARVAFNCDEETERDEALAIY